MKRKIQSGRGRDSSFQFEFKVEVEAKAKAEVAVELWLCSCGYCGCACGFLGGKLSWSRALDKFCEIKGQRYAAIKKLIYINFPRAGSVAEMQFTNWPAIVFPFLFESLCSEVAFLSIFSVCLTFSFV